MSNENPIKPHSIEYTDDRTRHIGFDQGVISLILTMKQFHDVFPETAPGHANQGFYVGFMTGMLELGAFVGCLF